MEHKSACPFSPLNWVPHPLPRKWGEPHLLEVGGHWSIQMTGQTTLVLHIVIPELPELEFLKRLWGLGTEEEEGYRTGPPGYIGWRNSFLGIDSGAPFTFKNTSSELNFEWWRQKLLAGTCQIFIRQIQRKLPNFQWWLLLAVLWCPIRRHAE